MIEFQEYFGEPHRRIRQKVKKFVEREINPFVNEWEEKGGFPTELYRTAGQSGILGIGYPEVYGGSDGDIFIKIAALEELMRCGSAGVVAGLCSLDISIPPILSVGSEEQKARFVTPVLHGNKIAALGVTEPSGGSDVANLSTKAILRGDHYAVSGSKMFITSGFRAHQVTCAVRTGEEGHKGISFLSLILIHLVIQCLKSSKKWGGGLRTRPRFSLMNARCLLKTFWERKDKVFISLWKISRMKDCSFPLWQI